MTTKTTTTLIVWNDCNGYDKAFSVIEIQYSDIPEDEDGEKIVDGIFATETGRFYTAL